MISFTSDPRRYNHHVPERGRLDDSHWVLVADVLSAFVTNAVSRYRIDGPDDAA